MEGGTAERSGWRNYMIYIWYTDFYGLGRTVASRRLGKWAYSCEKGWWGCFADFVGCLLFLWIGGILVGD